MAEHNFFGTPVMASNVIIPPDPMTVRLKFEWYGPSSKESCVEYGVEPSEAEAFAYFLADQIHGVKPASIGFALLAAKQAMPHKKLEVRTGRELEQIDRFDMPVRFLDGIKAAVKSLHERGFRIVIEPDLLRRCQKQDMETRSEDEWVKASGVGDERLEQF